MLQCTRKLEIEKIVLKIPKNYYFQLIDLFNIFKEMISSMFGFAACSPLYEAPISTQPCCN